MSVDSKHPDFTDLISKDWQLMQDSYSGEGKVKSRNTAYLPKPSGYGEDTNGQALYDAYKLRSQFPEILAPTISAMSGVIHSQEIKIELTDSLEYLRERATQDGLTLDAFHKRITLNLLRSGRYGCLVDAPSGGGDPFLAGYAGETLINWDSSGDFYVLDCSGKVRNGYEWEDEEKHIVLRLNQGRYEQVEVKGVAEQIITPTMLGEKGVERIPFVIGNALEVSPNIITPPLIGVARSAIGIYQLSADYRWQLFMTGQETLVVINGEAPDAIGAGVVHVMHGGGDGVTLDVKYVSPSCIGIESHRVAMSDNREDAIMAGAKFLKQETGTGSESGKSRKMRFASETASISSVANVSCEILEKSLRNAAMLLGLSEEQQTEITVKPPKDFMDNTLTPEQVNSLVRAWMDDGYSYTTLYENLQKGGIANPERTVDDELLLIVSEEEDRLKDNEPEEVDA